MEGAFRQIAEPDAPMKKHTGNQEWVCQISLSTVIWQSPAPCSLSEAHNSALVLTNYILHCFKTKSKTEPMTTNWPYAGNIKLLPTSQTSSCFLMKPKFNNKLQIMKIRNSNLLVASANTQVSFAHCRSTLTDVQLSEEIKISFVPLTCSCFPSEDQNSLLVVLSTTLSDTQLDLRATERS